LVWLAIRCFDLTPFNFLRERGFGSKSLTNKEIFKMENKTSVRVGKDEILSDLVDEKMKAA